MNSMEWLDGMVPSKEGKWTRLFVKLTQVAEVACFVFHEDMALSPVVGDGPLNTPRLGLTLEELASEVIGEAPADKPPISALMLARMMWMFAPHVAESEIESWGDKPVKDHPEAIRCLEVLAVVKTAFKKWIVTVDKKGEEVTGIFEDGGGEQNDERMVEFGSITKFTEKKATGIAAGGSRTLQ